MDRLIIFIFISVLYISNTGITSFTVPLILLILITLLLNIYIDNKYFNILTSIIFIILVLIYKDIYIFIIMYIYDFKKTKLLILITSLYIFLYSYNNIYTTIIIELIFIISIILKNYYDKIEIIETDYIKRIDRDRDVSIALENEILLLKDNEEVKTKNAILLERNNISRDIHDNVGHLISRVIIQIEALKITSKDSKTELDSINSTLKEAMISIRDSVHKIYIESSNIIDELNDIVDKFNFCDIEFIHDIDEFALETNIKNTLVIITKEAMNNIMKHSNATKVLISIKKYKGFIQYIIEDNGSIKNYTDEGIGIKNMKKRVSSIKGNINISNDNGFKIFITVPVGG